jgi:hypothetical protein
MNRAPFQLVDSRGLMGQLSAVSDHYQRKGGNQWCMSAWMSVARA